MLPHPAIPKNKESHLKASGAMAKELSLTYRARGVSAVAGNSHQLGRQKQ
jgi:hypothetical protein